MARAATLLLLLVRMRRQRHVPDRLMSNGLMPSSLRFHTPTMH